MPRYLYRVQYTLTDGSVTYEPVCLDAATEPDAREEVLVATDRFVEAVGATRTVTLVTTV